MSNIFNVLSVLKQDLIGIANQAINPILTSQVSDDDLRHLNGKTVAFNVAMSLVDLAVKSLKENADVVPTTFLPSAQSAEPDTSTPVTHTVTV